jgi:hypothetical protein
MLDAEAQAAEVAISNGLYVTYGSQERSRRDGKGVSECARVGPSSRCFCGHAYSHHRFATTRDYAPRCSQCDCSCFSFIPSRPEECGEYWLVRRKGFQLSTWRAKCKCGHGHISHHPNQKQCRDCGCSHFASSFACLVCDRSYEDHETLFERTMERAQQGKTYGDSFRPLSNDVEMQQVVFNGRSGAGSSVLRLPQVDPEKAERSVPHTVCG